ncbi:MAG: NAD-dependent epimerase/dehydratase family protein [Xanthomonadales bacterium]|nr:NAD-dependent epimerase/dehydratase family protein [Xanthomonadales bacterium]
MNKNDTLLVAGAGGFIGGHLVKSLLDQGFASIRAADIKPVAKWYQSFNGIDNRVLDLQQRSSCIAAAKGCRTIYNLACDMGGMGFIESNKALCMLNSLINTHLLIAVRENQVQRYFFASSACVYNVEKQQGRQGAALKEADAYRSLPEDGHGWEKLFGERMCRHFHEDFGLGVVVARLHNAYGPMGTYDGGREKAPAAICRKVIAAKLSGNHTIEIWGDGEQTRSFMYIDDCVKGINLLMDKSCPDPVNLGSSELVTINQVVDTVEDIAQIKLKRSYQPDAPKGVNGRNSDNTKIEKLLGWQPNIRLRDGLEQTYRWIHTQMTRKH